MDMNEQAREARVDTLFPNVDRWGAKEWFQRLVLAVKARDEAVRSGDDMAFETHNNIASSSATRLAHDYAAEVAAFLSPSTPVDGVGAEPSVKPLEWRGPDCDDEYIAFSIDKRYTILKPSDNGCRWLGGVGGYFATVDAAQAAARADHERRILSALASPEAEARLRERVAELEDALGQIEDHAELDDNGEETLSEPAQIARHALSRRAAEARLAQAERGPAVTGDDENELLTIAYLQGAHSARRDRKVTEAMVEVAARAYADHLKGAGEAVWEEELPPMRAALEAALHPQSAAGEEGK